MDVIERILTNATLSELTRRSNTGRKGKNIVNNQHMNMAHDLQSSMMHVRFNEAWHGKVHKQYYKLSGAHYATELHIEENTT